MLATDRQGRVPALDGLRGLAILMVVVFHYFTNPIVAPPGSWLSYLQVAGYLGWAGVDLFFVLSGYLIGGILLDHRDSDRYFQTFYLRRACRILPIYMVMVAILGMLLGWQPAGIEPLYRGATDLVHYFLFIQNYYVDEMGGYGPLMASVTWSLAIEEQFYLLVPLLIRWLPPKLLVGSVLLLILLAPLCRSLVDGLGSVTYAFCRGDSLMSGVLIAWLQRHRAEALARCQPYIAALFVVLLLVMAILARSWAPNGGVFEHVVFATFFSCLLLLIILPGSVILQGSLELKWLRWLGQRSYGIYLYHLPVAFLVFFVADKPHQISSPADFLVPAIALGLCLCVAEWSYRFLEAPLIGLGHRRTYRSIT